LTNSLSSFFKRLWEDSRGAVTITIVLQGTSTSAMHIADVEATADADATATIPHSLGVIPLLVTLAALIQATAALSLWAVTTIDVTNVVCTKATTASSGGAGVQLRVGIFRPHTIIR